MKSIFRWLAPTFVLFFSLQSIAFEIYNVRNKSLSGVEELVSSLSPGTVLVLGEIHDHEGHHLSHQMILEEMIAQGISFDVGMEFFYYPDQPTVERYLYDEITEDRFLKDIGWTNVDSFDWYRPKVLLPLETGGLSYAINAPRSVTRAIAKDGLESLPPDLQALMPPDFKLGDAEYFERFKLAVGGDHVPPDMLTNYFAAQSAWDETMAWQTLNRFSTSQQDVFVIIVGDFHVAFGGGVADSLLARGAESIVTVSHLDSTQMSETQKNKSLEPHPSWGIRSDWLVFADRE